VLPGTGLLRRRLAALVILAGAGLAGADIARGQPVTDSGLCAAAIAVAEPATDLPPHLLTAIGLVESGRAIPGTGTLAPWPWTINVGGLGRMFDSKDAAIKAVQAAQRDGIQSIDVGCMQINLLYHPQAFADLDAAFDPATNVAYAIRFLDTLHAQSGEWGAAIAAYHSATPELGVPYAQRVVAHWPDAPPLRLPMVLPGAPPTPSTLAAEVDPYHTLTPQFRAALIAAAAFRRRQEAHAVGTAAELSLASPAPPAAAPPSGRGPALTLPTLSAQVDPRHTLTPEFRAQLVAAAAERLRREHGATVKRAAPTRAATPNVSPRELLLTAQLSPAPARP